MMFGTNKGAGRVVDLIPRGSVGVEIGVWKGDTSERFLERASHLHLVDAWSVDAFRGENEFGGFREYLKRYEKLAGVGESAFQAHYDNVAESVRRRFRGRPVTIHRMLSVDFFSTFKDQVDWVYLDGAHSYWGVTADIEGAMGITSLIYGDDYGNKPDVKRAVDDCVLRHGLKFTPLGGNQYRLCI